MATFGPGIDQSQHAKSVSHMIILITTSPLNLKESVNNGGHCLFKHFLTSCQHKYHCECGST